MERDRKKRDIKKELQNLKEQAEKEFGVKNVNPSENGFIERATKILSREEKLKKTYKYPKHRLGKMKRTQRKKLSKEEMEKRFGPFVGKEVRGVKIIEKDEYSRGETMDSLKKKLKERRKQDRIDKVKRGNISQNVRLEDAVFGKSEEYGRASFYRIVNSASVVDPDAENLHERYRDILSSSLEYRVEDIGSMDILRNLPLEDVCYLDLETTGLRNSPLFLVGLMYSSEGKLVLDQFFARDYTEEASLIEFTRDFLKKFSAMITFNGKGFDIPFMLDRMKVFGIDSSMPEYHVDLLPISRKIVGKRTPNHKLNTLEAALLGRKRIADLPGVMIPELYHDYVRTGDAAYIAGIIKHNRIDLISLMRLIVFFLSD